jgi:hypothetical protein
MMELAMPNIIAIVSFVGGIGGLIYLCALVRKLFQ